MQLDLFDKSPQTIFFPPAGEVFFDPQFLSSEAADAFKKRILNEVNFAEGYINLQGKKIKQPRLIAWCGEGEYAYSGYIPQPQAFTGVMAELLQIANEASGRPLSGCLLNWYRNGRDSVGWHSDNEKGLLSDGIIVSLSLGEARVFKIRPKKPQKREKRNHQVREFLLGNGSLLIMRGDVQKHWEHCVPKTTKDKKDRINLTFRQMA